jgi:transposase-like protein
MKARVACMKRKQETDEDEAQRVLRLIRWLRWPLGVSCPRCGNTHVYELRSHWQWQCHACAKKGYRFCPTTGTALGNTKIPLVKWVDLVDQVTSEAHRFDASSIRTILPNSSSRTIRHVLKCLTPVWEKREQRDRDRWVLSRTPFSSWSPSDWEVPDRPFSSYDGIEMLLAPSAKVRKLRGAREKRSAPKESSSGATRARGVSRLSKT